MQRQNTEINRYALSGMAAFVPGMQYMIELMQRHLDEFRTQIARLQELEEAPRPQAKNKNRKLAAPGKRGWGGMTAAQRRAEMQRRIAVRKLNRAGANHPRHKDHPDHDQYIAKLSKVGKARWARMTKAQRAVAVDKIQAGRNGYKSKADLAMAS